MKNQKNILIIAGMMVMAAFTRLIPHPPDFTAVLAIALFGGARLKNRSLAILVPLVVMVITDLIIGGYTLMPLVYGCIVLTSLTGIYISRKKNPLFILGGSLLSSLIFFLVTNAGVWYHNPLYSADSAGLILCYETALPFFRNQVAGDLFFNLLLFGSYALAWNRTRGIVKSEQRPAAGR